MKNIVSEIIDELNNRMEVLEDSDEYTADERLEELRDFYDWFVEKYIY